MENAEIRLRQEFIRQRTGLAECGGSVVKPVGHRDGMVDERIDC